MNFGSRFVFPVGDSGGLDCPVIYDFAGVTMDTCNCNAVGTTYSSGLYTFSWKYYEEAKILPDTIEIVDNQTAVVYGPFPLRDPGSGQPEATIDILTDITNSAIGTYGFTVRATGDCGVLQTACTISYCLPLFSEGNVNPALTGSEIATLLVPKVQARYPGTFREFALGYKYFALPESMMETDALLTVRPNIVFQAARLNTDFVDPSETLHEVNGAIDFSPMYAMENSYNVTLNWGGPNYPYRVFRSTNIMHNPMFLEVLDHL